MVLKSYKEARTSKEVLILGVLEGVLARLELDGACTQFALTRPKEIKKIIKSLVCQVFRCIIEDSPTTFCCLTKELYFLPSLPGLTLSEEGI